MASSPVDALRLRGLAPCEGAALEIDAFVPFRFSSPPGPAGVGLVMVGDGRSNGLVEVMVDLFSGRLRGLVVVLRPRPSQTLPAGWLAGISAESGIPLFDPLPFGTSSSALPRLDDAARSVTMLAGATEVLFRFGEEAPDRAVHCGRAVFLFQGGLLRGAGARDLSGPEHALMAGCKPA